MSEFKLPDVGEGLTEAEIVTWRVAVGDTVKVNDIIVDIETAKSIVELPSPFAGVVTALLVEEGKTVRSAPRSSPSATVRPRRRSAAPPPPARSSRARSGRRCPSPRLRSRPRPRPQSRPRSASPCSSATDPAQVRSPDVAR